MRVPYIWVVIKKTHTNDPIPTGINKTVFH